MKNAVFALFLFLYIFIICGNFFASLLIITDRQLHTPMYFFLAKFAFMEIALTSIVIPKFLSIILFQQNTISFAVCYSQSFFYFLLGTTDFILLSVMSYDRYVAICHPLYYVAIMTWRTCIHLVIGCWFGGLLNVTLPTILKSQLPFCGPNKINHFFCDSVALIKLSWADTRLIQLIDFFLFSLVILGSLIVVIFTYTCILLTILRIPSVSGRQKAFSTCASHFTIMLIAYVSSILVYVTPTQGNSLELNKGMSVLTCFLTPVLNPFIMTLRNKQVKDALYELIKKRATRKGDNVQN
ncbi:olfactory receptor 6T1-like [Bombina bombina]|uniref:olfactory receptor 6T1-like n=1 Tax=Bombina bombina TaxID=8345 RepID=UPI00235AB2B4|nr:olfactory receptor 6T1-like [Bombina bombina]